MTPAWLTDTVTSNLDRAVHYTLLWGLEAVELRTVGGRHDRVPHVNEEKLRRRLDEHELAVAAVVPGMFEGLAQARAAWLNELAAFDETLRFCQRVGCRCVVVSSFAGASDLAYDVAAEALRRAGDAAARYDVRVAVLNERGMACATGVDLARLLDAADHPNVAAAWHPAESVAAASDAAGGLEALGARIALVRCADGTRDGSTWTEMLPGAGDVGWPHQLRRLRALGYDGAISLEVHQEPRPQTGLHAATALIHLMRT